MADTSGFVTGDDFIGFDIPSAGPSRAGTQSLTGSPATSLLSLDDDNNNNLLDALTRSPPRGWKGKGRDDSDLNTPPVSTPPSEPAPPKGMKRKSNGLEPENKRPKNDPHSTGPRNLKEERKAAERAAPWADDVEWDRCVDSSEMLNDEVHSFFNYMAPTAAESRVRASMIDLIANSITNQWPDAEVLPFGSWQTGLYLPTGDIDLVVTTPRMEDRTKVRLLRDLAALMRRARITADVAVISKAKVPIIKFVTNDGRLNVDISLNHPDTVSNGVLAAKIMQHYLDDLPGARELILVVKAFLSQRSMNEVYTGGLGSYSVICLVISFLQLHPKLRRSEMDARKNLGTLLCEFFELYGRNFNYDQVGISIRKGGAYYSKRARGWANYNNQPFLLSIEDPQDPDNNDVARSSHGIRQVKQTLAGAYDLLTTTLYQRQELINNRRWRGEHDPMDPQEASILSAVMGVTKETQRFRRDLAALDASGKLEDRLHGLLTTMGRRAIIVSSDGARGGSARETVDKGRGAAGSSDNEPQIRVRHTPPPASRHDEPKPVGAILVDRYAPHLTSRPDEANPVGAILVDDDDERIPLPSDTESEAHSSSDSSEGGRGHASSKQNPSRATRQRLNPVRRTRAMQDDTDSKYTAHTKRKPAHAGQKLDSKEYRKNKLAAQAAAKADADAAAEAGGVMSDGADGPGKNSKKNRNRKRKLNKNSKSAPGSVLPSREASPGASAPAPRARAPASASGATRLSAEERKAFWAAKSVPQAREDSE